MIEVSRKYTTQEDSRDVCGATVTSIAYVKEMWGVPRKGKSSKVLRPILCSLEQTRQPDLGPLL